MSNLFLLAISNAICYNKLMILTEIIYETAKGQGWIKSKCEFEGKSCNCIHCPEVWTRGNVAGLEVEE